MLVSALLQANFIAFLLRDNLSKPLLQIKADYERVAQNTKQRSSCTRACFGPKKFCLDFSPIEVVSVYMQFGFWFSHGLWNNQLAYSGT